MKSHIFSAARLSFPLASAIVAIATLLAVPSAKAATYYWDTNGTSTTLGGFALGDTAGIWGTSAFVATVPAKLDGAAAVTGTATTNADSIYFGTTNLALGSTASTIGIVGTGVAINTIVFGAGQGSQGVTLSGGGGTITLAGTITTNHTGAADIIGAVLTGSAGMVKAGAGTLTLTGANTYTGTTTINGGGTLQVGNGNSGNLFNTTPSALTFNAGGGTIHFNQANGSTQSMGALTFSAGDGTVMSTAASGGSTQIATFASLASRTTGATGTFSLATNTTASQNKITLTSTTNAPLNGSGSNNPGYFFGGTEYARYDTTNGHFRAVSYGTDNNASGLVAASISGVGINDATKDVKITGAITGQNTAAVNTLNLGANSLTLSDTTQVLSVNGLLSAGSPSAQIATAGKIRATANLGEIVIRVSGSSDMLSIAPIIQNAGAGASALTKSGPGTLVLSGVNTYTGTTTVGAGTLAVSGGAAIADAGAVVLANAANTALRLDGSETIGSLAGGGFSGGNVDVAANTLTIANANSQTFGGKLIGAGGVTVSAGTLTLSNKNTFAGTITLNGTSQLTLSYGSDATANTSTASSAGTLSMAGGTSLLMNPTAQVAAGVPGGGLGGLGGSVAFGNVYSNPIVVSSGTASIKHATGGGVRYVLSGGVTGGTSGAQTLSILQGASGGNGERTTITVSGVIANGSGGSTLGVSADFQAASSTNQGAFICLRGQNTFTGPIVVSNTKGLVYNGATTYQGAWFVVGGEITSGFSDRTVTPGSGYLGGGNYTNTISLATGSILNYASSANQILGGVISGGGNIVKEGSGTLTLSGINTYTGTTTVTSGGMLTLANTGGLKFVVTDAKANKVTGSGSATINGTFTIDTSAVTVTSGSWPLVDTTTKSFGSSFSLTGFTGSAPVFTKVNDPQIWTFNTTTGVLSLSSIQPPSAIMLTCDFGALGQAAISEANGTASLAVPPSQAVTSLAPTFTLSANATINPASGSTQNFTNPVVYRVTAGNGTTFRDYSVSVQTYDTWAHSGSLFIMTTPDGANLPAGASVSNFPLLIRFNSGNFNFTQAQADGRDIRFSTAAGSALSYEIEHWDSINGQAAVWVKIPTITGNARQEIKMYWGKSGVPSPSNGAAVFNSTNGYCAVMHLNGNVLDSTGSTSPTNGGATPATALIGSTAMNLSTGGISAANITNFPSGTNPTSSGQVWVKLRKITNWSMPLAWGNTNAYGWNTWQMQIGFWNGPTVLPTPLICRGPATLSGSTALAAQQWYHLVYTNSGGAAKLYVNGVLDGTASGSSLSITNPQALSLGMAGGDADVDEARLSSVARSADWVKLEFENQKPMQTLVGGIVPAGSDFSVSPASVTINENSGTTLTAQAGGAQKVYWIYKKDGQETLLATDQLTLNYNVGRITGNDSAVIQFKAVFAGGTQTIDVPLTVLDTIPDPTFTLTPSTTSWDGRQTMTVTANVTNLAAMQAAGFASLSYKWAVNGVAVIKQTSSGTLTLTRSQGSGPMTVTLTIDNGGAPVSNSIVINVQEPVSDPWVQRTPGATEKPVAGQFFARDPNTNLGTIFYNGTQTGSPDTVYLKVYKTPSGGSETLDVTHRQSLVGGAYAFSAPITAGLITYRVVYGTTSSGVDTDVATVTDLVCGDAFIIEGQSNALALSGQPANLSTDTFVRTYGTNNAWGLAVSAGNDYRIGAWGMPLALYLKSLHSMPICVINAAVGGTRIDQHQANPAGHGAPGSGNVYSIYANLFNRVNGAKLSHGIRGVFWHQGESNSGADSPTGDWDYKSYEQYFVDMSADWKRDFPNIRKYIMFQMQPKPCALGPKGDQLREVQRKLPGIFSNMSILSTIGIDGSLGHDGCHYTATGYQNIVDLLVAPLVDRDFYNDTPPNAVTAPNLKRAYYTNSTRNQIALEFDQPVNWNSNSTVHFYLDDVAGKVSSGSHSGNVVTLQLTAASTSSTIDYVSDQVFWDGNAAKLLDGANGIAALTFADVPISTLTPYESWSSSKGLGGADASGDADPDKDGVENAIEFVLGGEPNPSAPGSNSTALLPVSTRNIGGDLVFTFRRKLASVGGVNLAFQWSGDLTFPTPNTVSIGATSSSVDGVNVAISNFDAATETIVVTVPAAKATDGKLFGRLQAAAP